MDIDIIDDIMDMIRTMTVMGVSSKGLRTLDEMKHRVKETLKISEKKFSWTAKEVRNLGPCRKVVSKRHVSWRHNIWPTKPMVIREMKLDHNTGNSRQCPGFLFNVSFE